MQAVQEHGHLRGKESRALHYMLSQYWLQALSQIVPQWRAAHLGVKASCVACRKVASSGGLRVQNLARALGGSTPSEVSKHIMLKRSLSCSTHAGSG